MRLKINNEAKIVRYFATQLLPIELHSVGMYHPVGWMVGASLSERTVVPGILLIVDAMKS